MRIPWTKWLTAAWLAGVVAGDTDPASVFDNGDFENSNYKNAAVFTDNMTSVTFSWTLPSTASASSISLHNKDTNSAISNYTFPPPNPKDPSASSSTQATTSDGSTDSTGSTGSTEADTSSTTSSTTSSSATKPESPRHSLDTSRRSFPVTDLPPKRKDSRSDVSPEQSSDDSDSGFPLGVQSNSVTIKDLAQYADNHFKSLYFELRWGEGGISYSRIFTVIPASLPPGFDDSPYRNTTPAYQGTAPPNEGGSGTNPASVAGANSNSGGAHLSAGAIAGIVIGCVAALLLIFGALFWFFIYRRKRSYARGGVDGASLGPFAKAHHNGTQEAVAEKEVNGVTDASPVSPYSDDGNGASRSNHAIPATSTPQQTAAVPQERSFSPYSDHQQQTPSHQADELDPPSPTTSGRDAAQTPYRHLVEDGMTEDDIRRLEREERELDQAIEQAGRRDSDPHTQNQR